MAHGSFHLIPSARLAAALSNSDLALNPIYQSRGIFPARYLSGFVIYNE
jgi:hypothetical protein